MISNTNYVKAFEYWDQDTKIFAVKSIKPVVHYDGLQLFMCCRWCSVYTEDTHGLRFW